MKGGNESQQNRPRSLLERFFIISDKQMQSLSEEEIAKINIQQDNVRWFAGFVISHIWWILSIPALYCDIVTACSVNMNTYYAFLGMTTLLFFPPLWPIVFWLLFLTNRHNMSIPKAFIVTIVAAAGIYLLLGLLLGVVT